MSKKRRVLPPFYCLFNIQILNRIHRRFRPAAGGNNCLLIFRVFHVTRRKHTLNIRLRTVFVRHDIAFAV